MKTDDRELCNGEKPGKAVWGHIMNVTKKSLLFMQNSRRSFIPTDTW